MKASISHPIRRRVNDKREFIEFIIKNYPKLFKEWEEKEDTKIRAIAKEEGNGDYEIESSVYNSLSLPSYFYDSFDEVFYPAMFLMTYSYFDMFINLLAKKASTRELVTALCKSHNYELSKEGSIALQWIERMRVLRNNISHNNDGTQNRMLDILRLCDEFKELTYNNDTITISGPEFILKTLELEHKLLIELCDMLGYKTRSVFT